LKARDGVAILSSSMSSLSPELALLASPFVALEFEFLESNVRVRFNTRVDEVSQQHQQTVEPRPSPNESRYSLPGRFKRWCVIYLMFADNATKDD